MIDELTNIKNDIQEYIELQLDIIKLNVAESISRLLITIARTAVIIFFSSIILLFLSIAAALWIGDILGSAAAGFLIIAGFDLMLLLIFILFRKYLIEKPLIRSITGLFFSR